MRLFVVWMYSPKGDSGIRFVTTDRERACAVRREILGPPTGKPTFDVRIAELDDDELYPLTGVLDEHAEALCDE